MKLNYFAYTDVKKEYLGFNDAWFLTIGILFLGIFVPTVFFSEGMSRSPQMWIIDTIESMYYSSGYWLACRSMCIALRKRYPRFESARKRILLQLVLGIVISLVVGPLLFPLHWFVLSLFDIPLKTPDSAISIGSTILLTLMFLGIYESIYFYYQLKKSIEEKEAIKRLHLQSQWEGLRNQVNPHFLFNSLNTLMNIVHIGPMAAENFIKRLSHVYRYILESREDPLITLSEELDFIEAYVYLQKERFQPNLKVTIDVADHLRSLFVIPLALQILIENAIKHNIISMKRPLHVQITGNAETNTISVTNNLQRKRQVLSSTKVGLNNLKARYAFFDGKTITVEEEEAYFKVTIPMLEEHAQSILV